MKYTKEQLQQLMDCEVESLLNEIISGSKSNYKHYLDRCEDLMPLAFERGFNLADTYEGRYKSELNKNGKAWIATFDGFDFKDINPLRAIACCLILVLQERKL